MTSFDPTSLGHTDCILPPGTFELALPLDPDTLCELHVFTDGGFFPGLHQAGWSVVAVAGQRHFDWVPFTPVGNACGNLCQVSGNNFKAELFALGFPLRSLAPFRPGSCLPLRAETASLHFKFYRALRPTRPHSRVWQWLPSHCANAWNEAADTLAGARQWPLTQVPASFLKLACSLPFTPRMGMSSRPQQCQSPTSSGPST